MTSFFRNLLILGWKCQILRRRSIIITILEFAFPVLIFLIQSSIFGILFVEKDKRKNTPNAMEKAIKISAKSLNKVRSYNSFLPFFNNFHLMYAPRNNFSNNIMGYFVKEIERIGLYSTMRQSSKQTEEELVQWLKNESVSYSSDLITETPAMGIFFSEIDSTNNKYTYELRTTSLSMITNDVEDGKTTFLDYITSAFLGMQVVLDKALLWNANVQDELPWLFGSLPSEKSEEFLVTLCLYVFLVFAYLFLVVSVIKDVVDEKECGTKELTKVMGVESWMIWFHWFVYTMMVQLPVILATTFILAVWRPVAISAGVVIVFMLFLLFTINFTIMLFAVSCLFYKTTTALTICLISWFILNLLIFIMVIIPGKVSLLLELLFSLFPLTNLCWTLSSLWSFQSNGVTWTWGHLFTKGFTKFRLSVGASIAFFILSTLLSAFILIYLDAIFPGPYGVPKPLTFVCQWIRERLTSSKPFEESEIIHESPENFEVVGKNAKVGISLRGLHKRFGLFTKVVAVEKVDLNIYEGEIMALLGHNGAGKTTTMSMITGMTAPTNGVIIFEGQNITVNKTIFRQNLGLCPQHNLYFSKLTVIEHLMFFGMLKGMSYSKSKTSGKNLLYSLNMLDKATTRGSKLSGGMKRRLCLAVSLTGNPKVVILDEPTSGLDPETRRLLWDIILKMRGERTVLITTHFMEEADVLGDRIAIMDHGRVVCCGTSMFLKKLFGAGYQVHILKTPKAAVEDISSVVKQYMPQPQVNVISDVQVDYIIKEEFVEKFPALFSALERQKSSLDITGITLTCASMEDVFLKVATLPIGNSSNKMKDGQALSTALNINEFERVEGKELYFQKLKALFERRIIYRKRHIVSLLIKSLFILFFMMYLTLSSQIARNNYKDQKPLLLNLKLYPDATVLMAYDKYFVGIGDVGEKVAQLLSGTVKLFPNISNLEDYLEMEMSNDNYNYIQKILFALTFNRGGITVRYHANRNVHAPAIAINFLANVLLLNKTNGTGMIQAINHPYVNTHALGVCDKSNTDPLSLEILVVYPYLLFFSLAFIILLGDFLWSIQEERVTGFKHQLFLAGASPPVYWFVNLTFDFCVYFIVTLLLLMVFSIFGPKITLMHFYWFGLLLLVFFLQGCSGISFTYIYSFFIDSPGTSFALYNVLMICLAMFPALVVSTGVLELFPLISFPLFLIISHLLCLNPVSATVLCLRDIIKSIVFEEFCRVCTDEICYKHSEVLRMPTEDNHSGILSYLAVLIFTSILYTLIVILVDCGLVRKVAMLIMSKEPDFSTTSDTDNDVKLEIAQVEAFKYEDKETPLRVESLEKTYMCGPRAVDKVSFLVMKGDCFGLLGVNGAGKSTTFKMLTAEILPDKGDAYINNTFSVKTDRINYMTSVGYCPQFDAILPSLTGKEMLSIIAKIRGIPSFDVRNAVTLWLDVMGILEHGEKCCGTYSGGTKRKLSTAMALIGSPEVVLMDEPTTGVDPASRRKLWTAIKDMQKQGQAVVLTSHSMEECEALCTRLTIMVEGRMKCIGSAEYLKTKFGKGFTVLLKLNEHTAEELELLKQDFDEVFPKNTIKDEHEILIHYTILNPKMLLSQLFTDLLQFKRDHPIVLDFTASNTTLEELFLSFARNSRKRDVLN